ncbi:host cell division inhibitor Icd-like protein [Escherichia coli]|nr:host cell division inhibitor Icd-like protein [Escherichia coli]EEZ5629857.1 ash family protein [Escherichia coli O25]EGG6417773.1 ash family protein [Salmonella enterica subsp. enterica serovar Typhimurium]MBB2404665.1 host cell division inhibitor Icd-like protein [Escherichia sp. 14.0982]UAE58280.1 host cell division inhibitor Icd-like protein [Salmonella enterica subsp. enterica serovar Uganda var. 15+]
MCNALTVTKRESAPLPERLCERIFYCAILLTVYEADYSVVVAQSEGADHRYYSTPEMRNILLQNAVGNVVRKAKKFAGGATDTIFSGCPVLINYSCSLALRRWRRLISPFAAVTKKPAVLSPGSLSCSISSITSCGILTVVICDFAFFAPVAISGSPKNWCMSVYAKKMIKKGLKCISPVSKLKSRGEIHPKEQRPAVLATHTGRLTTNDSESIEVAMRNHTTHPQGRDSHNLNKYIWRFIALSDEQPRVIHIEATSEQEARQQSPAGCVMVFAARIRQEVNHG